MRQSDDTVTVAVTLSDVVRRKEGKCLFAAVKQRRRASVVRFRDSVKFKRVLFFNRLR